MPNSVLEAIRLGFWNFEPQSVESKHYDSTEALPGSKEKVAVLAQRVSQGLPLWHPADRRDCDGLYDRKV